MLRSVAGKTLRDARRGFVLWSAGLVGVVALMISVWPTVRDDPSLNDFVRRYPDALKNMIGFGGALDYTTPAGYLGAELFSFMVPLLLIIATVAAGSGALAGEEERGTMELMLAAPVSRDRVVAEKLAALVAEVAGLAAVLWVSLLAGAAIVGMRISAWHLGAATLSALLVAVLYGTVALAIGAATGRRSLAIGLTSALAVAAYLVNVLAPLAPSLAGVKRLSPFYYYSSSDPLRHGLGAGDPALLAAVAAVVAAVAVIVFRRRDIAV